MTEPFFVGIQLSGLSLADEGEDHVLDTVQDKGAVNALVLCTHAFSPSIYGRNPPSQPWPDHGVHTLPSVFGGSYTTPHEEYYANTTLPAVRAQDADLRGIDVLEKVLPKAHARQVRVFSWIWENPHGGRLTQPIARTVPEWVDVLQEDAYGRPHPWPCFRNPDYVNWWLSIVEDQVKTYPIDGIQYGSERRGPLVSLLQMTATGWGSRSGELYCFCAHCRRAAADRGLDAGRARLGYLELERRLESTQRREESSLVEFVRTLLRYPEVLAWEAFWHDGAQALCRQIYGTAKSIRPELPVGWHVWHQNSFSPLHRACTDFAEMATYSDFIKPVLYHTCAGPRFHTYVEALCRTAFIGVAPETLYDVLSDVLGYQEGPFHELPVEGFSGRYVESETRRTIEATSGKVDIYPGIDIDVVTQPGEKHTAPDDVHDGVAGAIAGGATGVILSRNYSEMWLDNLAAAGSTLRDLGKA